jgi:hypothetical protein
MLPKMLGPKNDLAALLRLTGGYDAAGRWR